MSDQIPRSLVVVDSNFRFEGGGERDASLASEFLLREPFAAMLIDS